MLTINPIYGLLLKTIVFDVGSLCFLTQFIRFHGFLFFEVISWILLLKNNHLVFFTVFLKFFQFKINLEDQYISSLEKHLLFHYLLDCFVILTHFVYLLHIISENWVNNLTIFSNNCMPSISVVLMFLKTDLRWMIKSLSLLLPLHKDSLFSWMNFF